MFEIVDLYLSERCTPPCIFPPIVIDDIDWTTAVGEYIIRVFAPNIVNHRLCNTIEYHQIFFAIFHSRLGD